MRISDHKHTFSGSEQWEVHTVGQYVLIDEATGPIKLRIDGSPVIERNVGDIINTGFKNQRIIVTSATPQAVKLITSEVRQDRGRDEVSVTTTTIVDPSNSINGVAAVTVGAAGSAQIAAGNANRVRLVIKVSADQPDGVWVAEAASSAGNGSFLEPGESIVLGTSAAVWAYGNGSDDVDVSALEEEII